MKALRAFLIAAGVLLLQSCSTLPPVGNPVAAPDIRVGDTWVYHEFNGYNGILRRTLEYRVRRIEADRLVVEVTGNGEAQTREFSREWNPHTGALPGNRAVRYDPPYPMLRFPLEDGNWKDSTTATDAVTGARIPVTVYTYVQGRERIRTAAGEFEAIKLQRAIYPENGEWWRSRDSISEVIWYSPDARAIVRYEDGSYYIDLLRSPGHHGNVIRGDRIHIELASFRLQPR